MFSIYLFKNIFSLKYSFLNFDDNVEVIIESYADYYITKNAYIDGNKLYIIRNIQEVSSIMGNVAVSRTFEYVEFVD